MYAFFCGTKSSQSHSNDDTEALRKRNGDVRYYNTHSYGNFLCYYEEIETKDCIRYLILIVIPIVETNHTLCNI